MTTCYIALGSNLEDRRQNINRAIEYLKEDPAVKVIKVSSLIETEPEGITTQPSFLNGVVKINTDYSAQELLRKLQAIETRIGRKSPHPPDQPRPIDLDILLYGELQIDEPNLKIPHPRMWKRKFVTLPLKEIAPELFKQ